MKYPGLGVFHQTEGGSEKGWLVVMATCRVCGRSSKEISQLIGLCRTCLLDEFEVFKENLLLAHAKSRISFGLPPAVPEEENGVKCRLCGNACTIKEGGTGFCGNRTVKDGKVVSLRGGKNTGHVEWYLDPLPTNCVASWVCPAGDMGGDKGSDWRSFSVSPGPEYGYYNLAVFYKSCTFDCLFCQNWHFKERRYASPPRTARELAEAVTPRTTCICYFGGDPASQPAHAIAASKLALEMSRGRILRICWETNGSMSRHVLQVMARLSMESGGCIKFDLKAFDERLHLALTGVSNRQTLENFAYLSGWHKERDKPPFLIASTTLVPEYINADEVSNIARFIASCDVTIPYSLLVFHPQFMMSDLPTTSRRQAYECLQAAQDAGLRNVHLGNIHLLS